MATQKQTEPQTGPEQVRSKTAWKKRAEHPVTLPSGAQVTIKLPNLAHLVKAGVIPNPLIEVALKAERAKDDPITEETLRESWDFVEFIVPITVVEPAVEASDVDDLPKEDVEMIVAFAQRQIDTDAVGHQVGGLETVKSFREARGIFAFDPTDYDLAGDGEGAA